MDEPQLHVEVTAGARDAQRVLRCRGPLTMATVGAFQSAVRGETAASLIIDLSEVPYLDSGGLGSLINAYVSCQRTGRRLTLVGLNQRARALLQMTNVEQLFHICASLEEAEQALA
jgi:anti-sigma B factor antagonist